MMNLAEQGAYLRLLCHEWADPHCTLPDDDEQLAVLSGLGEGWFNGGSVKIRACFQKHPKRPLRIFNVRLRLERRKQEAWRRKSREGGVRSGESRRNKPKGGSSLVESVANQKATLQSSSSDLRNTPPLPSGETPRASQTGSVEGLAPEELVLAWNANRGGMAQALETSPERRRRLRTFTRKRPELREDEFGAVVKALGADPWACGNTPRRSSPLTIDELLEGDAFERQRERGAPRAPVPGNAPGGRSSLPQRSSRRGPEHWSAPDEALFDGADSAPDGKPQ
jgi:uncharacterized protein YdaU (DUF1376 family)